MEFDQDRLQKILGLGSYKPNSKYVCFLPCRGEFGWYLMNFVKRIQGYNHDNKIVCIKPGHECLFPSAQHFFYDWQDITDNLKAGIIPNQDNEVIKRKITEMISSEDVFFVDSVEASWEEKLSLAGYTFIPQAKHNFNLKADVAITPRNRVMDPQRNWTQENWQYLIDELNKHGLKVGVCGARESSFVLDNAAHYAYNHVDVDSDVEIMNNAKIVISQESGLSYLSYLCKRPTLIIDHYHKDFGADLHRDLSVPFKEVKYVWSKPSLLVDEILFFFNTIKWIKNDSNL